MTAVSSSAAVLFNQQFIVWFRLRHTCLGVPRHTADLLCPSCAAAAAILAAVFAASSCLASSSAMTASRLASDSRDATVDAEGLRGFGTDFWGLRERLRGLVLAQGISWGCRFLGRWPDSQDFAGAGWNVTWPDLVLKPECTAQCCLLVYTNAEFQRNKEYSQKPGQCNVLEGLHFLQVLAIAGLPSYRISSLQAAQRREVDSLSIPPKYLSASCLSKALPNS